MKPLMAAIACHWMKTGIADDIVQRRITITASRVALAKEYLRGLKFESSPCATHIWLALNHPWNSDSFAYELEKLGISITPYHYFSTDPRKLPRSVRLSLGLPRSQSLLISALQTVSKLAKCLPAQNTFGF